MIAFCKQSISQNSSQHVQAVRLFGAPMLVFAVAITCCGEVRSQSPISFGKFDSQEMLLVNNTASQVVAKPLLTDTAQANESVAGDAPAQDVKLATIEHEIRVTAFPTGNPLDTNAIAACVLQSQIHSLRAYCKSLTENDRDDDACVQIRRCIAELVQLRTSEALINRSLQAHFAIQATTAIAAEQLVSLEQLQAYEQKQEIARKSGFAIKDSFAIDRVRLQLEEAAAQVSSKNRESRSQLAIACKLTQICDYVAVVGESCNFNTLNLCEQIAAAHRDRSDLRAIEVLQKSLCEENECLWNELVPVLNELTGVAFPHLQMASSKNLLALLHKQERLEQRRLLQRLLADTASVLRDRIASEVTSAWYAMEEAVRRLDFANQRVELALRKREQLVAFNAEVAVNLADLIDAEINLQAARIEAIQRVLECHIARTKLQFAAGSLR